MSDIRHLATATNRAACLELIQQHQSRPDSGHIARAGFHVDYAKAISKSHLFHAAAQATVPEF